MTQLKKLDMASSGKAANEGTNNFLLETLKRGRTLRLQFENECSVDGSRFLKPVARTNILNFAAENTKRSKTGVQQRGSEMSLDEY